MATKEEIGVKHGLPMHDPIQKHHISNAMEEYSKQEAIAFSAFKRQYQLIEGINVRHDQIENYDGNIYSWIGADDNTIWDAYKEGKQLKRYFEK